MMNSIYLKENDEIPKYPHLISHYKEIYKSLHDIVPDIGLRSRKKVEILGGGVKTNQLFYEDYEEILKNSLFSYKSICPLFPENIPAGLKDKLQKRYPGYQNFEYKSLFLYCKK